MLLVVLGLLGAAGLLLVSAPVALTVGRWQVRAPRAALALWFGALFVGCAAVLASIIVTVLVAAGAAPASGGEIVAATVIGWLGLMLVGGVIALVSAVSAPIASSLEAEVAVLAPLVTSREERDGVVLARFDAATPVACAVRNPEPTILLSSGMAAALTRPQLRAVLAHELAHLRGRHDWAVRIAAVNASCLPAWLPAGRALRRATGLLIELVADDVAARQAGAMHLANALSRLAAVTDDPAMALRAERLAQRRWPRPHRRRLPAAVRV